MSEEKIETQITIQLQTGVRWKCKKCGVRQDSVEGEEWQFHCNTTMSMIPFWKMVPVVDVKEDRT